MKFSKATVGVHLCTMLFGLSAVLAKGLSINASAIVAGRAFFAALVLVAVLIATRSAVLKGLMRRDLAHYLIMGVLLAIHWLCFFIGVEKGGVAVGTLGFACFPVFVSLFGWIIFRSGVSLYDLLAMFLVALGLLIISPGIMEGTGNLKALYWSMAAGASYAIIVLYNNHVYTSGTPIQSSFFQCLFCAAASLPFGTSDLLNVELTSLLNVVLIGVLCTGLAYSLLTYALRYVNAGKAAVIISLEPVWAIVFSILWFSVLPDLKTLVGGLLIIAAVIVSTQSKHQTNASSAI